MKPTWPKGYSILLKLTIFCNKKNLIFNSYTRKGLAEFYLHKYDESIASYKKVLEIEPTNT